ncbi:MAG TPA: hypothetical protein VFE46_08500 [Pirellulales bacterium]|nr:hypothetical protein [Pirellulales bacterium]
MPIDPLAIDEVRSSFYDNSALFPAGSITFDCALLMRGVQHEWHSQQDLCCTVPAAAANVFASAQN